MRNAAVVLMIAAAMVVCAAPTWAQEAFQLQGTWWQAPAQQTRHTTFVASFDSTENNNADYARDKVEATGWGMNPDIPGLHGAATRSKYDGGYLHFPGGSSFQAMHGTVRMEISGDVLASPNPFYLFETVATDRANGNVGRIGVKREPDRLSLLLLQQRIAGAGVTEVGRLDLPIGALSTDEWHSIVASWDRDAGTGWIALDGEGVTGPIEFPTVTDPAHVMFIGGSIDKVAVGGWAPAGLMIDDFVLYDLALPVLEAASADMLSAEDLELLPQAEAAARKTLNLVADLQNLGGWTRSYTWPTLMAIWSPNDWFINIDKGNTSMEIVANYPYGYQVLGDYRYVEVMLRMAEFLLAGQSPDGYWAYSYMVKPSGVEGYDMGTQVKIQDHVQSLPMYFLTYAYRLTGDERYREAAMRTGEFFLRIQNPDGSYSHHYDPSTGIGRTANGMPQGGELNDNATGIAITVLTMMYHFTGDPAYVQAIERIGDWLINVQGDDIPLWASQYDKDGNPIWARAHEPPAYGSRDSEAAMDALLEIYRFSGDDRYLEPVRKAISWMEQNLPNGMMYFYHEVETGRPIAASRRSIIYHLDDPEELEAALNPPPGEAKLGGWTFQQRNVLNYANGILESARRGVPKVPDVTLESVLAELPRARDRAREAMATQNEGGVWIWEDTKTDLTPGDPDGARRYDSIGPYFRAANYPVRSILRYIELTRMIAGEIPVERRSQAVLRGDAYPYDDWYDLDWAANTR